MKVLPMLFAAFSSHFPPPHRSGRASAGRCRRRWMAPLITVEYGRPQARGRDSLFGKVVTRDEMWTPGANAATTFRRRATSPWAGKPLPAGKYSVWIVERPGDRVDAVLPQERGALSHPASQAGRHEARGAGVAHDDRRVRRSADLRFPDASHRRARSCACAGARRRFRWRSASRRARRGW